LEVGDIEEALAFYGRVFKFELRGEDRLHGLLGRIGQHLTLLDQVIAKCEREVRPIHDSVKE
jgi:hypothetical protein